MSHRIRVAIWTTSGMILGVGAITVGAPLGAVVGLVLGAVGAVVVQRLQLAWFAANITRSEGRDWIDRVPTSLGALRRPLRAIEKQMSMRSEALQDAAARERLREVTLDALEMEKDVLDRALDDSRQDMAEVLAALDRALGSSAPQAILRRELVELRELVRLNVYAELPNDVVPLGDTIAAVVEGGVPRGRVQVSGLLPTVDAPTPLVEALVRSLLGHALGAGEHVVAVKGLVDGAMVVMVIEAPTRPEPTIHIAMARRSASILGGDLIEKPDRTIVVIPVRFVPNMRAIVPDGPPWDLPEAI